METIRVDKLRQGEHQLHSYCHYCDRWSVLRVDAMVLQWHGLACVPAVVPCAQCGESGLLKVRAKRAPAGDITPAFYRGLSPAA